MDSKIKELLIYEKNINLDVNAKSFLRGIYLSFTKHPAWLRWQYIKYLRLSDNSNGLKRVFYLKKKNKLGILLNIEINSGKNIDKGIVFFHNGPIVINSEAHIGSNCKFHGDNCIGNNGISEAAPWIGDSVEIGVGAKVIGNIKIANGVLIGAGAIVVDSIEQENAVVCGVPAKIVKFKD